MAAISTETREMLRALSDHQWHVFEEIRLKLAARIAPGRAMRNYEVRQAKRLENIGKSGRKKAELSEDERIRSGQLNLSLAAFHSMRKYLVFKTEGDTRYVRLRDDIPNPLTPRDGNNPYGLTEDSIRCIVREELQAVIDSLSGTIEGFEVGLRRYLEASLTELDASIRRNRR